MKEAEVGDFVYCVRSSDKQYSIHSGDVYIITEVYKIDNRSIRVNGKGWWWNLDNFINITPMLTPKAEIIIGNIAKKSSERMQSHG